MSNLLLLDPDEFDIDLMIDDEEKNDFYCKRLIEKWTPELESEMLEAFIRLYYADMYEQWGPDDEKEGTTGRNSKPLPILLITSEQKLLSMF